MPRSGERCALLKYPAPVPAAGSTGMLLCTGSSRCRLYAAMRCMGDAGSRDAEAGLAAARALLQGTSTLDDLRSWSMARRTLPASGESCGGGLSGAWRSRPPQAAALLALQARLAVECRKGGPVGMQTWHGRAGCLPCFEPRVVTCI